NTGDDDVTLLSAVLLPVGSDYPDSIIYTEGEPSSEDFEGVHYKVLGDGLVQQMPDGPATVAIATVDIPAGADLPATDGVAMYSENEGNFSFTVDSGAVQVSRSELESLQPNAVAGEDFTLSPGDAAFFPAGVTATSRADESNPFGILALTITFDDPIERDAATLTFNPGQTTGDTDNTAEADTDEPEEASGVIGSAVTTNTGDLNLRANPSTDAEVIDQLASGVELEVIGGPEDAPDFTWYEVQVTSQGGNSGWVAADFLDGLDETVQETPTASPETAATPESDTGATFTAGDHVVTTEEGVRIREEGNLGGEIIDALPAGTEYEITGEPEDADGYTWY